MTITCIINDDKRSVDSFELEVKKPTLKKIEKALKKSSKEVLQARSDYWIQTKPFEFEGKTYSYDDGDLEEE